MLTVLKGLAALAAVAIIWGSAQLFAEGRRRRRYDGMTWQEVRRIFLERREAVEKQILETLKGVVVRVEKVESREGTREFCVMHALATLTPDKVLRFATSTAALVAQHVQNAQARGRKGPFAWRCYEPFEVFLDNGIVVISGWYGLVDADCVADPQLTGSKLAGVVAACTEALRSGRRIVRFEDLEIPCVEAGDVPAGGMYLVQDGHGGYECRYGKAGAAAGPDASPGGAG